MSRLNPNAKGATIVELMVSVCVFAIGMQSLLYVISTSSVMAKRGEYAYVAHNIAKNRIERLRTMGFPTLSLAQETSTAVNQDGDPDEEVLFTRSTIVESLTSDSSSVTVNVFYRMKNVESAEPMSITTVIYDE